MKAIYIVGILLVTAVLIASAIAFGAPAVQISEQIKISDKVDVSTVKAPTVDSGTAVTVGYSGLVTVTKTEALTGKVVVIEDEKHNLLTNLGRKFIHAKLSGYDTNASNITRAISISSDSGGSIAVTDTQLTGELTSNGFARNNTVQYADNSVSLGSYFINASFTATAAGPIWINSTGLNYQNAPNSNGNLFAELAITPQSMLISDKLDVSWNITAS